MGAPGRAAVARPGILDARPFLRYAGGSNGTMFNAAIHDPAVSGPDVHLTYYLCFFSQSSRDIAFNGAMLLPWSAEFSDGSADPVIDWNWLVASSSFF